MRKLRKHEDLCGLNCTLICQKKNLDGLVEDGLKVKQFNAEGTIKYGTDYGNQKRVFNFEQNLLFKSQ